MAETAEQLARERRRLDGPGDPTDAALVTEVDVLRDGESVDQVELLVDRGNAELHGRQRSGEPDLVAPPGDGPLVRLVGASKDLDQGGLAGAILSEQGVHLARPH